MKQGMFEYGTCGTCGIVRRGVLLGVKTPDHRTWCMTGCSALSGQMSFKDMTERHRTVDSQNLMDLIQMSQRAMAPRFWGFAHDGTLTESSQHGTYAGMLAKATEVSRLLKLGVGTNPFLTTDDGYPYLTDGHTGFRFEWESYRLLLKFPKEFGHKVLKMIVDPVHLNGDGKVLSPIQGAIDLIEKHEDVLCDPFADRDVGHKSVQMIRQIVPGMRQKVRAVTRGPKKEA